MRTYKGTAATSSEFVITVVWILSIRTYVIKQYMQNVCSQYFDILNMRTMHKNMIFKHTAPVKHGDATTK